jgi:sugar/nucleoside kinase (ribokinase family)
MLLGCIGNDSYGQKIKQSLEKDNAIPLLEINSNYSSSRCAVAICLKERCLLPEIRASTHLSMDFVQKNINQISESELILIEGYFLIEKYEIVKYLVKTFQEGGKKIAFTLSATFIIDSFYDRVLETANESHIITCNHEEANSFSKCTSSNMEEVALNIHKKLTPMKRLLIITCGKSPAVISSYNYIEQCFDFVLKSYVYPISAHEIVDTDGAGDCIL